MDYTTLANVKQVLGANEITEDSLLARLITEASRAIDRHLCGAIGSDDYLKLETVTDELGSGLVGKDGRMTYFPRKPLISAVSALSYRFDPSQSWTSVDTTKVQINGYNIWALLMVPRMSVQIKISYSGGLAATTSALPADVINAADILAVRFYKEIKSGLGDTIGVADLGTLQYTRAWPVRVVEMLNPYKRIVT